MEALFVMLAGLALLKADKVVEPPSVAANDGDPYRVSLPVAQKPKTEAVCAWCKHRKGVSDLMSIRGGYSVCKMYPMERRLSPVHGWSRLEYERCDKINSRGKCGLFKPSLRTQFLRLFRRRKA